MTFITNIITKPSQEQQGSFGRLRVCAPYTIIDTSHLKDINDEQETSSIVGAGTITLNPNSPFVLMNLTGAGTLIKQTRGRGIYQPSKSLLVYLTAVINVGNDATCTSRIGYFDDDDGIYFEYSNGWSIVIRTSSSGVPVNDKIIQANWNFDKMDGTGPSGIVVDSTKVQIYFIDFEWLGVGKVRTGFLIDGIYYFAHIFTNSNTGTLAYMNSPNQPIRYEISSTGGAGSLRKMCAAVVSEGGDPTVGRHYSLNMGITFKTIDAIEKAIIGIRIKASRPKATIRIDSISGISEGKKDCLIQGKIIRDVNPLTANTWISNSTVVEYNIDSTAYSNTGAILVDSNIINLGSGVVSLELTRANNNNILSVNLAGISDTFVVTGIVAGGTDTANIIIGYTELN
jgi:hypothetical protein